MKKILKTKLITALAFILVTVGLVGVLPTLYFHFSNNGSVTTHGLPTASAAAVKPGTPLITGKPISISVPSVNINIPVINGYYNQKTRDWTLSLDKAQFATPTVQPNNLTGNTFIYGHARVGVFYSLPDIKSGDKAIVTTDNGYRFTYSFYSTYATQPTDLSVLTYKGPSMLTLQTCSGTWYQNRQMYLFSFVKYEKV